MGIVLGWVLQKQGLRQRFRCSQKKGNEGSRMGQKNELNKDVVSAGVELKPDPTEISEVLMHHKLGVFFKQEGRPLVVWVSGH